MKSYQPLITAFRGYGMSTKDWVHESGYPRSAESANQILHRGAPADPDTLVYMAHCLGMGIAEIVAVLVAYKKECPDRKVAEVQTMIDILCSVMLSDREQDMLDRYRKLPAKKQNSILDLMEG